MGSGRAWAAWAQPTERGRAAIVPLLPARSGFVGLLRPALRLAQLAGIPNPVERRRWALRTVLGVGSDVGWALLLARTDSELLVPRLMLDVADVASWATCDPRSAAAAVMLNAPLVTEVAVRRTPQRAAMLGAGMLLVAGVTRQHRGQRINPFDVCWAMIGPLTGWVWRLHEQAEVDRVRARFRDLTSARASGAQLAGQRQVAMAADSIIDLLCRTIPMVDPDCAGVALRGPLAQWKAELAEASRASGATFLGDLLLRWQTFRNTNPAVSTWVWPTLGEDMGTILLHRSQATDLWTALEAAGLSGHLDVSVSLPASIRCSDPTVDCDDESRTVIVGGHVIQLTPPPRETTNWSIEPTPIALVLGALWAAVTADRKRYGVAIPVAVAGAVAFLGAAVVAQRSLRLERSVGRRVALQSAAAVSATFAVLASRSARHVIMPGAQLAATAGANALGLVTGVWAAELDRRDRAVVVAGAVATFAGAWRFAPRPRSTTRFAAEMIWPFVAFMIARQVPDALRNHAAGVVQTLESETDAAVSKAITDGRDDAWETVRSVVCAVRDLLEVNRAALDHRVAEEATKRIQTCEEEVWTWMTARETDR